MTSTRSAGAALALALTLTLTACDGEGAVKERSSVGRDAAPSRDAATLPDDPDASSPDCVTNPKTHAEIINACTDAVKITKNPTLPLLLPDGGLPPLP